MSGSVIVHENMFKQIIYSCKLRLSIYWNILIYNSRSYLHNSFITLESECKS